ncbi:hypothetical protein H5410_057080 [Solanum commersonii]|uniref:Uncharacterized protein n=1 Tax=Solanum commersonii TaxID=4109 RepID=A0A9J5WN33_SOLCO|nr:hypothetical protein H5410_057080 [Solanum commersonii]
MPKSVISAWGWISLLPSISKSNLINIKESEEVRVFQGDGKYGYCVNFVYACFDFVPRACKVDSKKWVEI